VRDAIEKAAPFVAMLAQQGVQFWRNVLFEHMKGLSHLSNLRWNLAGRQPSLRRLVSMAPNLTLSILGLEYC
jgi:hypothetical protein